VPIDGQSDINFTNSDGFKLSLHIARHQIGPKIPVHIRYVYKFGGDRPITSSNEGKSKESYQCEGKIFIKQALQQTQEGL